MGVGGILLISAGVSGVGWVEKLLLQPTEMLTVWRSSGPFLGIKVQKRQKQRDGAGAASHPDASAEAPAQRSSSPDVDLHRTKFSRNPNKTQTQQGFSHSLWKLSISVPSERSKRSSGGTKFVLTAKKCRQSRGHVALATRAVTDDDG